MNGFIYIIKNTINSKVYIGQTRTSVEQRWKEHLRHAQYGDQLINRAMKKYGIDKFYIETLEICSIEVLNYREMYYIDLFDSTDKSKGYNVSIGGNTPRFKRKTLSISDLVDLYVNLGREITKMRLNSLADKYHGKIEYDYVTGKVKFIDLENKRPELDDQFNKDLAKMFKNKNRGETVPQNAAQIQYHGFTKVDIDHLRNLE